MDAGAVARCSIVFCQAPDGDACTSRKETHVTHVTVEDIRQGWKVYAGSEAIGEVAYVRGQEVGVKSGRLVKHEYVIPIEYVGDAADGVVDLNIGRDVVTELHSAK